MKILYTEWVVYWCWKRSMGLFNDVDIEDFTHRRLPCQCNGKLKLMKQRENRQCVIATVSLHKLSIIRRQHTTVVKTKQRRETKGKLEDRQRDEDYIYACYSHSPHSKTKMYATFGMVCSVFLCVSYKMTFIEVLIMNIF